MSGDSADMLARVEEQAARISSAGKTLVCLGGDHFVTLPLLRGHASTHGTMALIHFDAHTDTYREEGEYNHGSMFYHAPLEGLIDASHSVQVGIPTDFDRTGHAFEVIDARRADLNIVGFDLVEVAPAYDHAEVTALAGASLVLEFRYRHASRAAGSKRQA